MNNDDLEFMHETQQLEAENEQLKARVKDAQKSLIEIVAFFTEKEANGLYMDRDDIWLKSKIRELQERLGE